MSRDRLDRDDEDLSALLDGELPPEREAELRARLERDAVLAERLSRLAALQPGLEALAVPRADEAQRLTRLREGVDSRLAGERAGATRVRPRVRRPRPALRWLGPAAATLAAGLLVYLLVGPKAPPGDPPSFASAGGMEFELAALPEEEIAIGLEYETLADLEVIEQLELLELLDALDPAAPI